MHKSMCTLLFEDPINFIIKIDVYKLSIFVDFAIKKTLPVQ